MRASSLDTLRESVMEKGGSGEGEAGTLLSWRRMRGHWEAEVRFLEEEEDAMKIGRRLEWRREEENEDDGNKREGGGGCCGCCGC